MKVIDKIRLELSNCDFDAILITSRINRLYATGFSSSTGGLIVTGIDAWFFTDSRYIEAAEPVVADAHVKLAANEEEYFEQIKKIIDENKITAIGFEDKTVTHKDYLELKEKLDVKLIPASSLLNELRAIKSPDELEKMIKAQRLAEKTFEEILPIISTNMTEKQLAAEITYSMLKNGADDKAFEPVVLSGVKTSMPHGVPEDIKIGYGFLTLDFGARLNGWCSDMTRTLCIGKPDDEMIHVYNTVLKAQTAGINAIHADVKGVDVDAAARSVIEDAGFGEFFGHGFGHGIGLEVHESPRASKTSEALLPCGATLSAEPGIYLPGRFGVRIEDVVCVTMEGCKNITSTPKDMIIL